MKRRYVISAEQLTRGRSIYHKRGCSHVSKPRDVSRSHPAVKAGEPCKVCQ